MQKKILIDELSAFFLCYNEEKNITNTVEKALPVLKEIAKSWELIVVNDGSKDNSKSVLSELQKKYPYIKVITHPTNRGYGAALKSGLYGSHHSWITFNDGDGQFDFKDISTLIKKQQQTKADMVAGYYLGRKVSKVRILGSKVWELAVFLLFGLKVKDIDCGFKLINKKIIDTIPKLQAERGPFISSELLIKTKKNGFKIIEAPVHHLERKAGHATGTDLNVLISGLKDLITLWFKINFQE